MLLVLSVSTIAAVTPVSFQRSGLAQGPIEFEVASVKVADPNAGQNGIYREGARFYANNATLNMLIGYAYDLRPFQVSGGPKWSDSRGFTIVANVPPGTAAPQTPIGRQQLGQMLQSLLRDRFKLTVRSESKMETVYELVVSKEGSKLKEAKADGTNTSIRSGPRQILGSAAGIDPLVRLLSQQVGRPVTNRTGLTGRYDFTLTFEPDLTPNAGAGPSIFIALEEQLGLELKSVRGPVEAIVILSAEEPSEN
jgi:uncharacterized protein (TIGR03435 family)